MAKPSRWSQWVITESANPQIPMPWAVAERVRNVAPLALPGPVIRVQPPRAVS